MENNEIKDKLGYCGLHCGKCFAFNNGKIQKLIKELQFELEGFEVYANRYIDILEEPQFSKYPEFKKFLDFLSLQNCKGCRYEECKLFKTCKVRPCTQAKNVDFCFECEKFPCKNTGFDKHLEKRYEKLNQTMKETGIEAYYNTIKDRQRYIKINEE